jgi:hypothetical protein
LSAEGALDKHKKRHGDAARIFIYLALVFGKPFLAACDLRDTEEKN